MSVPFKESDEAFREPKPADTKAVITELREALMKAQAALSADMFMADTLTLRVTLDQMVAVANDYLKRR